MVESAEVVRRVAKAIHLNSHRLGFDARVEPVAEMASPTAGRVEWTLKDGRVVTVTVEVR